MLKNLNTNATAITLDELKEELFDSWNLNIQFWLWD